MKCRKNVKDLTTDEKSDFVAAVLKLKNDTLTTIPARPKSTPAGPPG